MVKEWSRPWSRERMGHRRRLARGVGLGGTGHFPRGQALATFHYEVPNPSWGMGAQGWGPRGVA